MSFTNKDREKLTELHTLVTQKLLPDGEDMEKRVRVVEGRQFRLLGINGLLSGGVALFTAWWATK